MPLSAIAAAFAIFGTTSTAHAAIEWETRVTSMKEAHDDPGGYNAWVEIWEKGHVDEQVEVRFDANGEVLSLYDGRQDGQYAIAEVFVYNKSGTRVDTDVFKTGLSREQFNLGTPDGSGDIPEGYVVKINVCVGNITCTGTGKGVA